VKKTLLLVSVILAGCSLSTLAAATLVVDNASHGFGEVLAGQIVSHTYVLSNTGDATLIITRVQVTCGCTVPSWETATLEAGSSIPLEATFSTAGYSGRVIKTVNVYYKGLDETTTRTLQLSLSATVLKKAQYDLMTGDLDGIFYLLVDLRSPEAYASRHLIGALNIPYEKLGDWIGVLPRGVFTVLYDQDGTLALSAAQSLRAAGYPDAQTLRGGLDTWTRAYGSEFAAVGAAAERFLLPAAPPLAGSAGVQAPIDASYLRREFLVLIDLRSPEAYAAAHFAGAVNVQTADLSAWVARLPASARIILYDEDGSIARPLATALVEASYKGAQALFGGLAEWRAAFGGKLLVTIAP
jgi:rhodanese-related sulfurtransferase